MSHLKYALLWIVISIVIASAFGFFIFHPRQLGAI